MTKSAIAAIKASAVMIAFIGVLMVIWHYGADPRFMSIFIPAMIILLLGGFWAYLYCMFRMKNP